MIGETGMDDQELLAEFDAAHEITEAPERGSEEISLGDVAAINGYRNVFSSIVSSCTGELPET